MDVVEMLKNLFVSEEHQARWAEDPQQYLEDEGATDLSVAQINEAAQFAFTSADLGANVNVGGNQNVGDFCAPDDDGVAPEVAAAVAEGIQQNLPDTRGTTEVAPAPQPAPPAPPAPSPQTPPAQQIEETINYYVTNVTETNVDDRDTYVDNSVDVINIGDGDVDIDQDTTIASGDGSQAVGGDNDGAMNTGDGGVAIDGDNEAPIGTGSGPVVDASGGSDGGDGGTVIIGDDNENNEVEIDLGEGGTEGPINIGIGSGETNQDNHTEDNDGVDYDDNDGLDIDVELDFGLGSEPAAAPALNSPVAVIEPKDLIVEEPAVIEAAVMPVDYQIEEAQLVIEAVEPKVEEAPMVEEVSPVEVAVEEIPEEALIGE